MNIREKKVDRKKEDREKKDRGKIERRSQDKGVKVKEPDKQMSKTF